MIGSDLVTQAPYPCEMQNNTEHGPYGILWSMIDIHGQSQISITIRTHMKKKIDNVGVPPHD